MALLRRAEDAFVDDLYEDAPRHGAGFLKALFPRSYVDPNRHEGEIDPGMLAEAWPTVIAASERTEMGLGLIRRLIRGNVPVYDRLLPVAEIEARIAKAGLRMKLGEVECINPESDTRFRQYWESYHRTMGRDGVTPEAAKAAVRRSNTLIGALAVHLGDADAMLCGMVGRFDQHLEHVRHVIGCKPGEGFATLNALMLPNRTLFIADTYVNEDPDAELLAHIARMSAVEVRRFGLPPKVAFLSHSNYGSSTRASALKMRRARDLFRQLAPEIECDGELQGDAALSESVRRTSLMDSTLGGEANLLVCPNLDAANILFNVLKTTGGSGVTVGPMLLGSRAPVHVLTPSATVRRIVNMTALVAATAGRAEQLF